EPSAAPWLSEAKLIHWKFNGATQGSFWCSALRRTRAEAFVVPFTRIKFLRSTTAEREAAEVMLPRGQRRGTLGGDKNYDVASFVRVVRAAGLTPHVAQKVKYTAIEAGTTRHPVPCDNSIDVPTRRRGSRTSAGRRVAHDTSLGLFR